MQAIEQGQRSTGRTRTVVSTRLVSSLSLECASPMLSRASQKKGPGPAVQPFPGQEGVRVTEQAWPKGEGAWQGGRGGRAAIFAPARSPRRSKHEYRCFPHLQPAGEDDLQRQGLQVRPAAVRVFFPGTSARSGRLPHPPADPRGYLLGLPGPAALLQQPRPQPLPAFAVLGPQIPPH